MHSIKSIADDLASTGKPLDHEYLIDRVLDGLDSSYDLFVEQIDSCDSSISFEELHEKLINKELALQKQESSRPVSVPAKAFTMHSRSHNFRSRPSRMNPDNHFRNFSRQFVSSAGNGQLSQPAVHGQFSGPSSRSSQHSGLSKPFLGKCQWCGERGHVLS